MFIDTNREPSDYQDDHYVSTAPDFCHYREELQELRANRRAAINHGSWTWILEEEARLERQHLLDMIEDSRNNYYS